MNTSDIHILKNLYNKVLLNEISQKYVNQLKDAIKDKELSFNNIFNNKLRIVIPVKGTETYREILDKVSTIPNFSSFDPQKKEVIKKIKLDPKYGGGEKEQRVNLGKAISMLKLPEEEKKKYLNWYANYNTNIPEMENLQKYSVVISRNPIDILRMSDIGDITSCHSQGGSYFYCAIQEAKRGGPIAYLVKTEDIKKLSDQDLQMDEIFADEDRNIKGIKALSRLRIRRYLDNKNKEEIAIPEVRIYGKRIEGFYDTVKNFFKNQQSNFDPDTVYKKFQNKEYIRTGGSYTDSSDSELFNKMYNTDTFRGSLRGEETDDEEDATQERVEQFETELTEFEHLYANSLKHCAVGFDVRDEDGYVEYNAWGHMIIDLEDIDLKEEFKNINVEHYDIMMTIRYEETPKYNRSVPYFFRAKGKDEIENRDLFFRFKNFLQNFEDFCPNNFASDLYGIFYSKQNNSLYLQIKFNSDAGEGISGNTDDFRYFCQTVSDYDDEYEKIKKALIKALKYNKFINLKEESERTKFLDKEKFAENLQTFQISDDKDGFEMEFIIGRFDEDLRNDFIGKSETEKYFGEFLENYVEKFYKPKQSDQNQMQFKNFFEAYNSHYKPKSILKDFDIDMIKLDILVKDEFYRKKESEKSKIILTGVVTIYEETLNEKNAKLIKFLDENSNDIINSVRLIISKIFKIKNNDYIRNLEKLYGKYFKN